MTIARWTCIAFTLLAPAFLASAAPASDETTTALSALPLDVALLPRGERTLDIGMKATGGGEGEEHDSLTFRSSVTLRTVVEGDHVVLDDTWEIMGRRFRVQMRCRPEPGLPLVSCAVEMQRGDAPPKKATLTVEGDVARIEGPGPVEEMPFPADTLTQAAALRLLPMLPRTPGVTYTFPSYCESLDLRARKAEDGGTFGIRCHGPVTVTQAGVDLPCTRYDVVVDRAWHVDVDAHNRIRRIVADEGATVMVARTSATAAAE